MYGLYRSPSFWPDASLVLAGDILLQNLVERSIGDAGQELLEAGLVLGGCMAIPRSHDSC